MDYVLLGFLLFFVAVGIYKGFVKAIFSFVSTFLIVVIAWKFCPTVADSISSIIGKPINLFFDNTLNNLFPGTFSDISQFQAQISQENFVFSFLINKILANLTFEGTLTAGQILSPTLSNLLLKVIAFLILFICLAVAVKILRFLLDKFVKISGLNMVNRALGGVVGLFKGILYFAIFYLLFCAFANFTLNENMLNFVASGHISKTLYDWFIEKIINLFY